MSSVPATQRNIADEIRRARLEGYKSNPTDILEHYRSEEEERKNYVGRPLLELVQNAEDAMAEAGEGCPCGLMVVHHGETLVVANHGKKFTHDGVQALCDRSKSPKRGHEFIGSKGLGFKAVLNWTDRPSVFSGDIAVCFDRERARVEILEALTPARLDKLGHLDWSEHHVPLLRLPFGASPDVCCQILLSQAWDTVLVLPIKEGAQAEVKRALTDPVRTSLPFLCYMRRLDFLIGGKPSHFTVARTPQEDGGILIQIERYEGGKHEVSRYKLFRSERLRLIPVDSNEVGMSEVAIAYAMDAAEAQDSVHSLHAFFPTLQPSPCPGLLVHGTFLLTPDRNALREDDPDYQDALSDSLATLLQVRVIPTLVNSHGREALRLLRFTPEPAETQRSLRRLWRSLREAVIKTEFIPATDDRSVQPSKARIWRWKFDALFAGRARPEPLVRDDWQVEPYAELLRALGVRDLEPKEYLHGLATLQPETPEKAIGALEVVGQVLMGQSSWSDLTHTLRKQAATLKLWMTFSGNLRALGEGSPLFYSLPSALVVPEWLRVDALDPTLAKWLDGLKDGKAQIWPILETLILEHVHRYSNDVFLRHVLCPQLEGMSEDLWPDRGHEILRLIVALDRTAKNEEACVDQDSLRGKLSALVRIPDSEGKWRPARDLYAGTAWGGRFGEILAQEVRNRYLLASPEAIKGFVPGLRREHLQYVGVSWLPKLVFQYNDVTLSWRFQMPDLAEFSEADLGEAWQTYFEHVLKTKLEESDREIPRGVSRWIFSRFCGVEGLEVAATSLKSTTERLQLLSQMWSRATAIGLNAVVKRQGPQGGGRLPFIPQEGDSFVAWQIRSLRVFDPEESCLLAEPPISLGKAFLQPQDRSGWKRWLPILRIEVQDEREEKALEKFATDFGSRSRLERVTAEEWLGWLNALHKRTGSNRVVERDSLKQFLHSMARELDGQSLAEKRGGVLLPCDDVDGSITFVNTDRTLICDDIQLDPLRQALAQNGCHLLVSDAGDGTRLARIFGLEGRCLTGCLTVKRAKSSEESPLQKRVVMVLAHKAKIVSLIEQVVGNRAAEQLCERSPQVMAYKRLVYDVALAGTSLPSVSLPYRRVNQNIEIDDENLWENCAAGLLKYLEVSLVHVDTLVRLFNKIEDEDASEVMRFLRARDVSEQDVRRWHEHLGESAPPSTAVPVRAPGEADAVSGPNADNQKPTSPSQPLDVSRPASGPAVPRGQMGLSGSSTYRTPTQHGREGFSRDGQEDRRSAVGSMAERRLEEMLKADLPDGWEVQKGGGNLPYDFRLDNNQTQVFIDAKADSPTFFLSMPEVQHATENQGRHIVALVSDVVGDETPRIQWLWDPLATCVDDAWKISGRVSFSETDYPGTVEPWEVPDVADVMPRTKRFAFAIRVPSDANLPEGMSALTNWLNRLEQG